MQRLVKTWLDLLTQHLGLLEVGEDVGYFLVVVWPVLLGLLLLLSLAVLGQI